MSESDEKLEFFSVLRHEICTRKVLKTAKNGLKWQNLEHSFYKKELTQLNFLIKFGLSDLKLVGIGAKIIKIGPEMPILEP